MEKEESMKPVLECLQGDRSSQAQEDAWSGPSSMACGPKPGGIMGPANRGLSTATVTLTRVHTHANTHLHTYIL